MQFNAPSVCVMLQYSITIFLLMCKQHFNVTTQSSFTIGWFNLKQCSYFMLKVACKTYISYCGLDGTLSA